MRDLPDREDRTRAGQTRRGMLGGLGAGAAVFASGAGGCVSAGSLAPPSGAIRLERTAFNEFMVLVRVNGTHDLRFKVDTGAAITALYADYAQYGDFADEPEEIQVWGLGGTAMRPVTRLGKMELGRHVYIGRRAAVLPARDKDPGAVGIIGMDILKEWVIESRPSEDQFLMYPVSRKNWRRFRGWRDIPLTEDPYGAHAYGLKFGWMRVRGTQVPTLFDIGSEMSLMNWDAAKLVPDLRRYWTNAYNAWRYYGAVGSFTVSGTTELREIIMGDYYWDRADFIVTDLDSLTLLGSEGEPLMIAGANLFADRDFVFDPSENLLQVRARRPGVPGVRVS